MPIQLKAKSKLQLYAQSAHILRDFLISKDSLKNLVYAPDVEEKKATFALVIQTLKYRNVLLFLLSLAQLPGCRHYELAQYDRLLGLISAELALLGNADGSDPETSTITTKPTQTRSKTPATDTAFTTRQDPQTTYYESMLFLTKKSRLLWSQDQSKKEQQKNSENQAKNAGLANGNEVDDDGMGDDDDDDDVKEDGKVEATASADDEGDTTGISNSWFSAFITYNHVPTDKNKSNPNKPKPQQPTPQQPAPQEPTPQETTPTPTVSPANTNPAVKETYRFPIECLLVLTYDLLFGSKELPKLSELKMEAKKSTVSIVGMTPKQAKYAKSQAAAEARLRTFQQGIVDCIALFNLPNPPKPLSYTQISTRTKLIQKGQSYTDLESNAEAIDVKAAKTKKMKKSKDKITTKLTFPIVPSHYLDSIPMLPTTGEFSIGPGVTFKQRLGTSLKYLTTLLPLKPNSTPQQIQQQQHPDLFIPNELRGHYKRSIPRYIRINTNKVNHKDVIDKLIKEYNYTQLDVVPHMYQFPRPLPLSDSSMIDTTTTSPTTFDQFDTRIPGFLDKDLIVSRLTPNLRRSSPLWTKYFPMIERTIVSNVGTKVFAQFMAQALNYKQSTAAERQQNQLRAAAQGNSKSSVNIFWIDPVLPDVLCFAPRDDAIVHSEMVKDGSLVIQDRSSCLPPAILNPPPNSICIDACSAPGNKTSYLSALLKNTGKIYAIELNQTRAKLMQNRMQLTNSKNVEVVQTSFFDVLPTDPKYEKVEYIMLDPSCSGSGNIHTPQFLDALLSTSTMISPFSKRQHLSHNNTTDEDGNVVTGDGEDRNGANKNQTQDGDKIRLISPPSEQLHHVESLSRLQIRLIKHAMTFPNLKAFIYSTCSVYHSENENVVLNVLPIARQHGFDLVSALPLFPGRGVNHPAKDNDGGDDKKVAEKEEEQEDEEITHKSKKQKQNAKNKSTASTNTSQDEDQVLLGADLNKTVRVDHSLYHAGGFYVALFAKPGAYPTQLLDSLLDETKERYPKNFQ